MAGFATTGSAGSLRRMMNLRNGQLKGIVHFKLFVAVQGLSQAIEEGCQTVPAFTPFTRP